jgi:hypothetical protein
MYYFSYNQRQMSLLKSQMSHMMKRKANAHLKELNVNSYSIIIT